jgi:hypothetical protein
MPFAIPWARLTSCLWLLLALTKVCAAATDYSWFSTNHVMEVAVQIAPADWDVLRYQHRESDFFPEENGAPTTNAYTWFPAEVTVDGEVFASSKVRKKGYIGSNDTKRPSLKIQLGHSTSEVKGGASELTLNNNNQDPALIRQYLAYRVFARAGVPAPRCSFARVTVDRTVLGVYTHVESLKKPFLERSFGRDEGQLYEGGRSDFRTGWFQNFEIKFDGGDRSRADLAAATKAIEDQKASLLATLERYLDLNEFLHYWAVESLIGDRDGYAANANNFYVYHNPANGKFEFIPWGKDTVMYPSGGRGLNTVIGVAILPNRVYNSPEGRERYRAALREVLKAAWNEHDLVAETDRLERLLKPVAGASVESFSSALQSLRQFISQRRSQVEPELAGPAPELTAKPMPLAKRRNIGHVEAHFSVKYGSLGFPELDGAGSTATLRAKLYDRELQFGKVGVQAGSMGGLDDDERPGITIRGTPGASGRGVLIYLTIDPESYTPNVTLPVDNTHVSGGLLETDAKGQMRSLGAMLRGSLHLRAAGHDSNAPVEGELIADVFSKMPEP